MWSEKAWDEIQRYFPNDNTKSRILITSRELHVAKHADTTCEEHQMHLLSDAQGWDLLCLKVFGRNLSLSDPHFLEEIGRKIVSDCRGLPLAISVIGGLLSVDKYSEDLWVRVAKDIRSITDNHISKILCLSYDKLPLHLKPCFLYMSVFPEDFEVRHSKLVKLLVAEGFLWRSNGKNCNGLEDVAEEHLKSLVDRNLLSITRTKYNGRAESCSMHDLLRDVCVRKAEEEKFLRIFKNGDVNSFRRVSVHHHEFTQDQFTEDIAPGMTGDLSCSRSLLYITPYPFIDISSILSTLRLLRVLNVYDIHFDDFPTEILKLANLRLLVILFHGSLPSAIWRLQNLQTLQVRIYEPDDVTLPHEAWEISSLRHIIVKNVPIIIIDFKVPRVHENLQTIGGVCLDDLLASNLINNIPNIKELKISGYGFVSEGEIIDLSHLQKLETLKLESFSVDVLSLLKLPDCLKKLSYFMCTLPMRVVNSVGDLQYLEVLKIDGCEFQSEEHNEEEEEEGDDEDGEEEWDLNEGVEFDSLQLLWLQNLRIKCWKSDYSNFPRLRHLKIGDCEVLEEIPACFEEMSTLELIEVSGYNPSHVDWANHVRETQREEYGNETLKIRMH